MNMSLTDIDPLIHKKLKLRKASQLIKAGLWILISQFIVILLTNISTLIIESMRAASTFIYEIYIVFHNIDNYLSLIGRLFSIILILPGVSVFLIGFFRFIDYLPNDIRNKYRKIGIILPIYFSLRIILIFIDQIYGYYNYSLVTRYDIINFVLHIILLSFIAYFLISIAFISFRSEISTLNRTYMIKKKKLHSAKTIPLFAFLFFAFRLAIFSLPAPPMIVVLSVLLVIFSGTILGGFIELLILIKSFDFDRLVNLPPEETYYRDDF